MNKEQIEDGIVIGLQAVASKYSESEYHTNAGKVLRFIVKIIPITFLAKIVEARLR